MTKDEKTDMPNLMDSMNNSKVSRFHYRTWWLAGMGFFTDAYDLFIIGMVLAIMPLVGWSTLNTSTAAGTYNVALIGSTALLSAVIGAVIFGRLLDKLGRKAIYGIELILLVAGALGSAFLTPTNSPVVLIAWRFLLGIGIGGDYATSSTIMAEYSNTKNRGKLVGMVFSMQSLGLIAGPAIALGLMYSGISLVTVWQLLLAFGAIPAALVIYGRRKLPEPPRYTLNVKGDSKEAVKSWENYTGLRVDENAQIKPSTAKWHQLFTDRKFLLTLIATAGSWFLMDWALYGNSIMSTDMIGFLVPASVKGLAHIETTAFYSLLIFVFAAFPGYWLATFTVDRIGRKPIQMIGFLFMAITFAILALFPFLETAAYAAEFLVIYGLSYFFIEFGPNVTTFIYPPEVFPTSIRGLGAGASAAGGKTGAFVGTFLNLFIVGAINHTGLFMVLSVLAAMGLALTFFLLPEPKRIDLEEISGDNRLRAES
ncbi:MAG: MFS transporter [Thermoplasmataceae archaeon]